MGSIAASWASTRSCPPMSAAWGGGTSSLCVLWLVIVESIRFPLIMIETCCSLFTLLGLVCARVWNLLLICNKWTDSTLCRWSRILSILYLKKVVEPSRSTKGSKRTKNFHWEEDEVICSGWLYISKDPINGANQTRSTFWSRVWEGEENYSSEVREFHYA